ATPHADPRRPLRGQRHRSGRRRRTGDPRLDGWRLRAPVLRSADLPARARRQAGGRTPRRARGRLPVGVERGGWGVHAAPARSAAGACSTRALREAFELAQRLAPVYHAASYGKIFTLRPEAVTELGSMLP